MTAVQPPGASSLAHAREHTDGIRNMLEHIRHRDRVESPPCSHRPRARSTAGRSHVSRRAAYAAVRGLSSSPSAAQPSFAGERNEPSGVGADVQQSPPRRIQPPRQRLQNPAEDDVLVVRPRTPIRIHSSDQRWSYSRSKNRGRAGRAAGWANPHPAQRRRSSVCPEYAASSGSCVEYIVSSKMSSCTAVSSAPPHTSHVVRASNAGTRVAITRSPPARSPRPCRSTSDGADARPGDGCVRRPNARSIASDAAGRQCRVRLRHRRSGSPGEMADRARRCRRRR